MLPRPDSPLALAPKALSILASLSWGASTPFFRNGMWAFLKQSQSPMTQPWFECKSVLPFLFFELTKASGFLKRPICVCLRSCLAGQFIRSCYLVPSTKHSFFSGNIYKVGVGFVRLYLGSAFLVLLVVGKRCPKPKGGLSPD